METCWLAVAAAALLPLWPHWAGSCWRRGGGSTRLGAGSGGLLLSLSGGSTRWVTTPCGLCPRPQRLVWHTLLHRGGLPLALWSSHTRPRQRSPALCGIFHSGGGGRDGCCLRTICSRHPHAPYHLCRCRQPPPLPSSFESPPHRLDYHQNQNHLVQDEGNGFGEGQGWGWGVGDVDVDGCGVFRQKVWVEGAASSPPSRQLASKIRFPRELPPPPYIP